MTALPDEPDRWLDDDHVPIEELARRQGVKPISSIEELMPGVDPFESDEEYDAFLVDLYASRRGELA